MGAEYGANGDSLAMKSSGVGGNVNRNRFASISMIELEGSRAMYTGVGMTYHPTLPLKRITRLYELRIVVPSQIVFYMRDT